MSKAVHTGEIENKDSIPAIKEDLAGGDDIIRRYTRHDEKLSIALARLGGL